MATDHPEYKRRPQSIIANRDDAGVDDVKTKIYTRDIFHRD